ncbi:phage tail protein [Bradyrhizobium guangdongense]|uniref:Phage tail protein n=2 Tax=Bradyrhizobium guangdongense TaxID=1325090 RepID=A0ABX6UBB0_9BRAD|nr:tail fiber protein [Bradyrhizobium guangdongense]QAU37163.1 phage tail protein [Bradyrhizobium guangdongense]QOZ58218.1 phage tail protein [Bradyrhizobium guangdongense]
MMDPFVAEIRMFGFNFPPKGWAFCDGQLLPISQNTALFSLLGTTYGGNGISNFQLPNMQGSAPMHPGQGPGLSLHDLGEMGGTETVTLLETEMPIHSHAVESAPANFPGNSNVPTGNSFAKSAQGNAYIPAASLVTMSPQTIGIAGGGLPHNNMQPYLTLNFCIALQGVFPPRG